jgi:hypothetical protein
MPFPLVPVAAAAIIGGLLLLSRKKGGPADGDLQVPPTPQPRPAPAPIPQQQPNGEPYQERSTEEQQGREYQRPPTFLGVGANGSAAFLPRPGAVGPSTRAASDVRPGAASVLLPSTRAEALPGAQRQAYETAAKATAALLAEYEAYARLLPGFLEGETLGDPQKVAALYAAIQVDTNAMRRLAKRLRTAALKDQAYRLDFWASAIDDARSRMPAPGGGPLQPPTHTSPFATTRGTMVPGVSFIVKPSHFNDLDNDKKIQTFLGRLIPLVNSAIGLGQSQFMYGWEPLFDVELGRQVSWTLVNPITYQIGHYQLLNLPIWFTQIPGFQDFIESVWIVPDGTRVNVLWENLPRPGSPISWARVRFQLPSIGSGPLGTQEGFIPMQDLVRRMVYSEGSPV